MSGADDHPRTIAIPVFGVSADADPATNAAAWGRALETFFEIEPLPTDGRDSFSAEIESYAMGPILFGRARAGGQRFRRTSATIARSGVDHMIVQLYVDGGFDGTAGVSPVSVQAGDICVFDLAQTLETIATPFENLTLVVPHAMIDWRLPRPDILHGLVLPRESALAGLLGRHFQTLFALAPRMTVEESHAVAEATVGLIVACMRGEVERRDLALGGTAAASLIRVRLYIEKNLTSADLSAESVANHFGMSRSSLYRLFASLGGIAEYIRARRLHRALFDLATPDTRGARVSEVARRWKLGTETSFTRAFKAAYGITPSAAREAALVGGPRRDADRSEPALTRWMREMAAPRTERGDADACVESD